jgi:hypothetical protein
VSFRATGTSVGTASSGGSDAENLRAVLREELVRRSHSPVGPVFRTVLSPFAVLVGLRSFQFARYASSTLAAAGVVPAVVVVTGASFSLLDFLHWT